MAVGYRILGPQTFPSKFPTYLFTLFYDVYRGIADFRGWLCRLQPGPA